MSRGGRHCYSLIAERWESCFIHHTLPSPQASEANKWYNKMEQGFHGVGETFGRQKPGNTTVPDWSPEPSKADIAVKQLERLQKTTSQHIMLSLNVHCHKNCRQVPRVSANTRHGINDLIQLLTLTSNQARMYMGNIGPNLWRIHWLNNLQHI